MPDGAPPVDGETLEQLYGKLWLTRRFEEVVAEIYPTDKIKSPVHLSIGQESVAVGVCDALRADDVVSGTYRGHATYLAKGGDAKAMMAELFGKDSGCARGKGGSMHLVDMGARRARQLRRGRLHRARRHGLRVRPEAGGQGPASWRHSSATAPPRKACCGRA